MEPSQGEASTEVQLLITAAHVGSHSLELYSVLLTCSVPESLIVFLFFCRKPVYFQA